VALAAIILLALVLRVAVVVADTGYRPANDALEYDYYARSIASGHGYPPSGYLLQGGPTAIRGPAYPFLLGAVYAISGDSQNAGRLLDAALGALAVLLLYLVAKRVWGRRVALVAAAMAAIFPPLVLLSRDLVSESLFVPLVLGTVLCALEFRRSGGALRWALASGGLCGVAILTRPTGFALLLPVALGVWTLRPRLRPRAVLAPACALCCSFFVVVPWVARDAVEFGRFVPVTTSGGIAVAGTYNQASFQSDDRPGAWRDPQAIPQFRYLFVTPGIDEATVDARLRQAARNFAWQHPAYVVEATGWNLLRLFEIVGGSVVDRNGTALTERGIGSDDPASERIGLAIAGALALIALFAMVGSEIHRRRTGSIRIPRGPLFLWLVPILMIATAAPIAGLPRYRVPADPFLLILAAIGAVWLWERISNSNRAPETQP
jgi:4-amino-4-deoxy-L-arabinose transferase-like glycosyltransferase